jgi:hypothetical protein
MKTEEKMGKRKQLQGNKLPRRRKRKSGRKRKEEIEKEGSHNANNYVISVLALFRQLLLR